MRHSVVPNSLHLPIHLHAAFLKDHLNMSITYDVFRGSPEGKIVADKTTRSLEYNEVFIETIASGLCGTDEHFRKTNQVLGHEGVGFARAVGAGVTSVKVGDRVGFGFMHSICSTCDNCATGSLSHLS